MIQSYAYYYKEDVLSLKLNSFFTGPLHCKDQFVIRTNHCEGGKGGYKEKVQLPNA